MVLRDSFGKNNEIKETRTLNEILARYDKRQYCLHLLLPMASESFWDKGGRMGTYEKSHKFEEPSQTLCRNIPTFSVRTGQEPNLYL